MNSASGAGLKLDTEPFMQAGGVLGFLSQFARR